MITEATVEDLPDLVLACGDQFFAEGKLGKLNHTTFLEGTARLINSGQGAVFILRNGDSHPVGAIGGAVLDDFLTGQKALMEMFWYVLPSHRGGGLKLLRRFEQWGKAHGAVRIWMIHLMTINAEALEKIYPRLGYSLAEKLYTKDL